MAKLCAYREKDLNFAAALLNRGLVDHQIVATRLTLVPSAAASVAELAAEWLRGAI